eukprot:8789938-Ditylum_brightwellii.AAC.1
MGQYCQRVDRYENGEAGVLAKWSKLLVQFCFASGVWNQHVSSHVVLGGFYLLGTHVRYIVCTRIAGSDAVFAGGC